MTHSSSRPRRHPSAFLVVALGLGWGGLAPGSPATAAGCPDPVSNDVVMFQNASFGDPCRTLYNGPYASSADFALPNDSISSLKVGPSVKVTLFSDSGFSGERCVLYSGSFAALSSFGFNDRTSSIRIDPIWLDCQNPPSFSVAIFQHANYGGDCTVLHVGSYPSSTKFGLAGDSISSLKVGRGAIVTACSDANGGGRCESFGDWNTVVTLVGSYVGNDAISSLYVRYP